MKNAIVKGVNHRATFFRLQKEDSISMARIMQQFVERKNFMEIWVRL